MDNALLQFLDINRIKYVCRLLHKLVQMKSKKKIEAFFAEMRIIYKTCMIVGISLDIRELLVAHFATFESTIYQSLRYSRCCALENFAIISLFFLVSWKNTTLNW